MRVPADEKRALHKDLMLLDPKLPIQD